MITSRSRQAESFALIIFMALVLLSPDTRYMRRTQGGASSPVHALVARNSAMHFAGAPLGATSSAASTRTCASTLHSSRATRVVRRTTRSRASRAHFGARCTSPARRARRHRRARVRRRMHSSRASRAARRATRSRRRSSSVRTSARDAPRRRTCRRAMHLAAHLAGATRSGIDAVTRVAPPPLPKRKQTSPRRRASLHARGSAAALVVRALDPSRLSSDGGDDVTVEPQARRGMDTAVATARPNAK